MILNLDSVSTVLVLLYPTHLIQEEDVEAFYNSSGITWKLTAQEARTIAGLKI